jgi:hypothetical protein
MFRRRIQYLRPLIPTSECAARLPRTARPRSRRTLLFALSTRSSVSTQQGSWPGHAANTVPSNAIIGAGNLGQVGLDWSLGGLAVDPPTGAGGAMGASDDPTSQLVQAMAGFAGGDDAAESLNAAGLGADASQQFLTIPQQA